MYLINKDIDNSKILEKTEIKQNPQDFCPECNEHCAIAQNSINNRSRKCKNNHSWCYLDSGELEMKWRCVSPKLDTEFFKKSINTI